MADPVTATVAVGVGLIGASATLLGAAATGTVAVGALAYNIHKDRKQARDNSNKEVCLSYQRVYIVCRVLPLAYADISSTSLQRRLKQKWLTNLTSCTNRAHRISNLGRKKSSLVRKAGSLRSEQVHQTGPAGPSPIMRPASSLAQ